MPCDVTSRSKAKRCQPNPTPSDDVTSSTLYQIPTPSCDRLLWGRLGFLLLQFKPNSSVSDKIYSTPRNESKFASEGSKTHLLSKRGSHTQRSSHGSQLQGYLEISRTLLPAETGYPLPIQLAHGYQEVQLPELLFLYN